MGTFLGTSKQMVGGEATTIQHECKTFNIEKAASSIIFNQQAHPSPLFWEKAEISEYPSPVIYILNERNEYWNGWFWVVVMGQDIDMAGWWNDRRLEACLKTAQAITYQNKPYAIMFHTLCTCTAVLRRYAFRRKGREAWKENERHLLFPKTWKLEPASDGNRLRNILQYLRKVSHLCHHWKHLTLGGGGCLWGWEGCGGWKSAGILTSRLCGKGDGLVNQAGCISPGRQLCRWPCVLWLWSWASSMWGRRAGRGRDWLNFQLLYHAYSVEYSMHATQKPAQSLKAWQEKHKT